MRRSLSPRLLLCSAVAAISFGGCAPEVTPDDPPGVGGSGLAGSGGTAAGSGGSPGAGGAATGGVAGIGATGGVGGSGGSSGGGVSGSGGSVTAGSSGAGASGAGGSGAADGGAGAGAGNGGVAGESAGAGPGGAGTGGAATGGAGTGGASGGKGGAGGGPGGTGGTGGQSTTMSTGCGKAPTIPSNMYNGGQTIAITAASMQRRFILNVPTNYDNTKPYKLIIAFHQLDGNDRQMYANGYYHLLNLSGSNAIFVAPNGQKNGAACTTMNNGDGGCGWPNTQNSDIALADAVVAQIKENFCVDTNRIFATGWSYGGSMSYKTACERPLGAANGYIRAIAAYSGAQLSGTCTPSHPVAYYGSHGDSDGVLGYDGGVRLAQNFATANTCNWMTPTKVTSGNHVCTDVMGCPAANPVKFCSFDGDHTPDPRDPGQQTSWQYQVVWDWFNQF